MSPPIHPTTQLTVSLVQRYLRVQEETYWSCCLLFRKSLPGRLLSTVHARRKEGSGTSCSGQHGKVMAWKKKHFFRNFSSQPPWKKENHLINSQGNTEAIRNRASYLDLFHTSCCLWLTGSGWERHIRFSTSKQVGLHSLPTFLNFTYVSKVLNSFF